MGKRVADMTPEERERKREYSRAYHEANRVADAERKRVYYDATRAQRVAYSSAYYEANREVLAERARKWREANREVLAERDRKRREANREANPEAYIARRRFESKLTRGVPRWFARMLSGVPPKSGPTRKSILRQLESL